MCVMKIKQEIFADGIGKINYDRGMLRFDWVTIQLGGEDGEPVNQTAVQIVMPIQGFFRSFEAVKQLADKLSPAQILTTPDATSIAKTTVKPKKKKTAETEKKAKTTAGSKNRKKKTAAVE